jgi:hypothetical protein
MSNHGLTVASHPVKRRPLRPRSALALGTALIVALFALFALVLWHPRLGPNRSEWPSVPGQVVGQRISIVDYHDHPYRPATFEYRAEAEVIYALDNSNHDTWLPASEIFTSREELQFWLSQRKSKNCIVRWYPRNPADVEAVLQP